MIKDNCKNKDIPFLVEISRSIDSAASMVKEFKCA